MLKTIIVVAVIILTPSRVDAGIFVSLGLVKPVNAFDKLDQGAVRVDAGYRFGILSIYTNLSGISVDTSIESNDAREAIQESSLGEYELYTAIGIGSNLYIPVYNALDLIVGVSGRYTFDGEVELSEDKNTVFEITPDPAIGITGGLQWNVLPLIQGAVWLHYTHKIVWERTSWENEDETVQYIGDSIVEYENGGEVSIGMSIGF